MKIDVDDYFTRLDMPDGDEPGDMVRKSITGLVEIEKEYGRAYRMVNQLLADVRSGRTVLDVKDPEERVEDLRRHLVLGVNAARRRLRTTINEHVPGSFPIGEDEPLTSGDVPCATISVAIGIAIATGQIEVAAALFVILAAAEVSGACA